MKDAIEMFLGADTFEELYEKAGRSCYNLVALLEYMMNLVTEELESKNLAVEGKYLQGVKQLVKK